MGSNVRTTLHCVSDAGVPGVAVFASDGAETFAELFQIVRDGQVVDEFYILVADLPGEPHAKWSAVGHGQIVAVHAVAEECLRMQSVGHIDAVPGIGFHRGVDNVFGLREHSYEIQYVGKRNADPLGDVGPTLFAGDLSDVTARWVALEVGKRK